MDSNTTTRSKVARLIASGGIVAVSVLAPTAAFAVYGGGDSGTGGQGGDPGGNSNSGGSGGNNSSGDTLPFTGGDVIQFALIGAGAIAGGTALVRSSRRRVVAEI